ncbi:MAG: hypothetical protein Q7R31_00895 [Candidatus Levybacteria bacterium]|nr:hypothetical protein [Candidatus Levybacteria bacterium]
MAISKKAYSTYTLLSEFHHKANVAREEDKHLEALKLMEEALIEYSRKNDNSGIAMAIADRALIYKHLFLLSSQKAFALLMKKDAQACLDIAQNFSLRELYGVAYFRLGEADMLFGDYEKAAGNYRKSLENYFGTNAEKGDFKYHLGEAVYKTGKKEEGMRLLLKGLKEIQENKDEVNDFVAHVWESGCYMRLAELLKEDNPSQAKMYLKKAQEIAESDEKLIIRRRQISELGKSF